MLVAPGGLLYFTVVNFRHAVYMFASQLHSAWNAAGLGFEIGPFADHTVHLTLKGARALPGLPLRVISESGDVAFAKRVARHFPRVTRATSSNASSSKTPPTNSSPSARPDF